MVSPCWKLLICKAGCTAHRNIKGIDMEQGGERSIRGETNGHALPCVLPCSGPGMLERAKHKFWPTMNTESKTYLLCLGLSPKSSLQQLSQWRGRGVITSFYKHQNSTGARAWRHPAGLGGRMCFEPRPGHTLLTLLLMLTFQNLFLLWKCTTSSSLKPGGFTALLCWQLLPLYQNKSPQEAQNDSDVMALEEACLQKLKKKLKTVAVCNQHNSWQNAEIQLLGTERKHHRGADQPNQATTKRKRNKAASNGRQSIWAPNIKNLRGSLQLYNQCPWCKVTHSYLSYANRKGEAWHPFHQAKHLCALWYCPLSRLLQKLNSFKLHTHTQLERNFLSSQLINLTVRLLFSEHILYELNKLYGRVDCQGSRKLETWCLTTARNSRLQESLAAAFAPQLL